MVFDKDYLLNMIKFLLPNESEEDLQEERSLNLAKSGWSIPVQFSYKQILEVGDDIYSQAQIDEAMLIYFTENNNRILEELVLNTILEADDISLWENIIKECFESFNNEKYLVIVPTLFTVLDGYVSSKIGISQTTQVKLMKPTRDKANGPHEYR